MNILTNIARNTGILVKSELCVAQPCSFNWVDKIRQSMDFDTQLKQKMDFHEKVCCIEELNPCVLGIAFLVLALGTVYFMNLPAKNKFESFSKGETQTAAGNSSINPNELWVLFRVSPKDNPYWRDILTEALSDKSFYKKMNLPLDYSERISTIREIFNKITLIKSLDGKLSIRELVRSSETERDQHLLRLSPVNS